MHDALPLWFWLPTALLLWGYLAVDAIVRRRNRKESLVLRTIVIAKTKAEGKKRFPHAVGFITPRDRDSARGLTADRVVVLRSMDNHPDVIELRELAAINLHASGGSIEGEPETPAVPTHVPSNAPVGPAGDSGAAPTHVPGPISAPPVI